MADVQVVTIGVPGPPGPTGGGVYDAAFYGSIPIADAAASAAGGGVVAIPGGVWPLPAAVAPSANVHWRGAGIGVTVLRATGTPAEDRLGVIEVTGLANSGLSDLTIDANNVTKYGGYFIDPSDLTFDGVRFTGGRTAHGCWAAGLTRDVTRVNFTKCEGDHNGYSGVMLSTLNPFRVVDCHVNGGHYHDNPQSGIDLGSNAKDCEVDGNVCEDNGLSGIFLDGGELPLVEGVRVTKNTCRGGLYGIQAGNARGCTITNNGVTATTACGIYLVNARVCTIAGNDVHDNLGFGLLDDVAAPYLNDPPTSPPTARDSNPALYLVSDNSRTPYTASRGNVLAGNTIRNNGQGAPGVQPGVKLNNPLDWTVVGNDFEDNQSPATQQRPFLAVPYAALTWPAWTTTAVYAAGDLVSHSGVYYQCSQANTAASGNAPGTGGGAAYWFASPTQPWASGHAYTAGQWVTNVVGPNLLTYSCTANHTSGAGTEPGVGGTWATKWLLQTPPCSVEVHGNPSRGHAVSDDGLVEDMAVPPGADLSSNPMLLGRRSWTTAGWHRRLIVGDSVAGSGAIQFGTGLPTVWGVGANGNFVVFSTTAEDQSSDPFYAFYMDGASGNVHLGGYGDPGARLGVSGDLVVTGFARVTGQARVGGVGIGNTVAATTLGTVVRKYPVYDPADGTTLLGYAPLYDAIT